MSQLNFFSLVDPTPHEKQVTVHVEQSPGGYWQATIGQGWWSAWGRTKAEAVKKVSKAYAAECHLQPPERIPVT